METLRVMNVRFIARNKAGETINRVFIDVDKVVNGSRLSLSRSASQFLMDLENSYLIPQGVTNFNDSRVLRAIKNIKGGGTVEGNISYQRKGDKYIITAEHPALTRTNHPLYGKVKVGQEVLVENDGARVTDGFLSFEESDKGVRYNAIKDAQIELAQIADSFFAPSSTASDSSSDVADEVESFEHIEGAE